MNHEDDHGMNGDSNLSQTVCVHLNKENSQGTVTLTDNKEERLRKNEGSSMRDDSHWHQLRSQISQVFQVTSHVVGIFALHFGSPIQLLSLYQFIQFLTCTRIPCGDSHCENGSCGVLSLHLPSVTVDRRQL